MIPSLRDDGLNVPETGNILFRLHIFAGGGIYETDFPEFST